jgi:arylsulfatase A-like enzyme
VRRVLLLAVVILAAVGGWLAFGPRGRRPDIVVLLWDTTRADRLSAYGHGRDTTPWLAGVAAKGVLYEQCRAPAPWTIPSHASLFTGLLPRHHGCVDISTQLAPAHETLAERLRDAGYDTVLISNNPLVGPELGLAQGFGRIRIVKVPTPVGPRPSAEETLSILRQEMALRKGDRARAGKPLFLFVNFMEPHLPYEPPAAIERPWRIDGVTEAEVREAKAFGPPFENEHNLGMRPAEKKTLALLPGLYDGEIRDLDDHCARFEAILVEEGVLGEGRDAFLAITSDHGENLGEGEEKLLDHKFSVSDRLLRVPLVIRWPGRLDGGRRVKGQVGLQDLFPTLLEVGGARVVSPDGSASLLGPPSDRPQVSEFPAPLTFLPLMQQEYRDQPAERFEKFRIGLLAVTGAEEGGRRLKWERRRWYAPDGATVERLYDLVADPGETRDLLEGKGAADLEAARRMGALAEERVK